MKIQCNACEVAEASVLCCTDELALCWACDDKIHVASKLASKHQRVPLSNSSSRMPKCDICQDLTTRQVIGGEREVGGLYLFAPPAASEACSTSSSSDETTGYFFCIEDRALLCRKCDVAIHTADAYVSAHRRFLLTGVKAGLDPISSKEISSMRKSKEVPSKCLSKRCNSVSFSGGGKGVVSIPAVGDGGLSGSKVPLSGGSVPGITPDWPLEDFLDFNHNNGLMEQGWFLLQADMVKLSDSEWSPIYRHAAEDLGIQEHLGQVPEISWTVPQIPSPPTASGLNWLKNFQDNISAENSVFVPDVCYFQNLRVSCIRRTPNGEGCQ